jgi:HEAT repeat protein
MDARIWKELSDALRGERDVERAARAVRQLQEQATAEDVPRLMEMLNDSDFFIREAAAWPLTGLAGLAALPQLLAALQRTFDDGHDGDGFQTALIELVEADKPAARRVLDGLLKTGDEAMRENAKWLLEFCETPPGA